MSDGALVSAAKNLGMEMKSREKKGDTLQEVVLLEARIDGSEPKEVKYKILYTMGFTSYRKRMDVILQSPEDIENQEVTILAKGADSHVRDNCLSQEERAKPGYDKTDMLAKEHADQGLRTLFVAEGKTSLANYKAWQLECNKVKDSDIKDEDKDAAYDTIDKKLEMGAFNEAGMELLGSTALEVRPLAVGTLFISTLLSEAVLQVQKALLLADSLTLRVCAGRIAGRGG